MKYINRYLRISIYHTGTDIPVVFDTNWKITFNVRKYASSNYLAYNQAEVSVYNMDSELRSVLSQKGMRISIVAGYEDKKDSIFEGVINNMTTSKNGTDIITTFYCASSLTGYDRPVQICIQHMTVTDLLAKICQDNGVPYELPFTRADIVTKSYSGTLARVIAMICADFKLSSAINNGILIFKNKTATTDMVSDEDVYKFTPNTGMLGSPTVNERGVSFQTLMNPDVQVNSYFRLEAPYANYNLNSLVSRPNAVLGGSLNAMAFINTHNYNGLYMVLSLTVQGDTRGNAWYTSIEGSRVWSKEEYA